MDNTALCRVCFADNDRMKKLSKPLQKLYEKLTDAKLSSKDGRASMFCSMCYAHLQRCCSFLRAATRAEHLLTQLCLNGTKNKGTISMVKPSSIHNYSCSPIQHVNIYNETERDSNYIDGEKHCHSPVRKRNGSSSERISGSISECDGIEIDNIGLCSDVKEEKDSDIEEDDNQERDSDIEGDNSQEKDIDIDGDCRNKSVKSDNSNERTESEEEELCEKDGHIILRSRKRVSEKVEEVLRKRRKKKVSESLLDSENQSLNIEVRAIEDILNNSDFGFSGDDDDEDFLPPDVLRTLQESEEVENSGESEDEEISQSASRSLWRKNVMPCRESDIVNDVLISQGSADMNVLYCIFEYLGLEFWELLAKQSNLYSIQKRNLKSIDTNAIEMIHFAGVQLMMGTLKYPQGNLYWSRDLCVPIVRDTIGRDRFFEIRSYFHLADVTQPNGNDKLWNIRPLIDPILRKCHSLLRSKHMSIDEQMIPFSGRCEYRQYVPDKPNALGLRNFVLAARDGLVLDFDIYVGQDTLPKDVMKNPELRAVIVEKLSRTINGSCVLYTNRFLTSLNLGELSLEQNGGIFLTETAMIEPVAKKLKNDKALERGQWGENVRDDENVCVVKRMDTKAVTMESSCSGSAPADTCKGSKVEKRKINASRPAAGRNYNTCMGGIDSRDRLIARYRSAMRTRKWTVRAFCHFLDLVVANCWIMYSRCAEDVQREDKLSVLQYRLNLAKAMMRYDGGSVEPDFSLPGSRSGPSTPTNEVQWANEPTKKHRPVVPQPQPEIRMDNVGHLPRFVDSKSASKCRHPMCSSRCRAVCVKCNVYLCVLKNNCFESYHTYKNFDPLTSS